MPAGGKGVSKVTLKEKIEGRTGSVYRFTKEFGLSVPAVYGILRRKRAISRKMLLRLEGILGAEVRGMFDDDGVLVQK